MAGKKRYHLNAWHHYTYLMIVLLISWYKSSYYSILHWIFTCIFIWHMGYKFLEDHIIYRMRIITIVHLVITSLIYLQFIVLLFIRVEDEQYKAFLEDTLNFSFDVGVLGYQSLFALILSQVLLYTLLIGVMSVMIINFIPPQQEDYEIVDDSLLGESEYTQHQRHVSYIRQKSILEKIMILIVLLLGLNDGLISFVLMFCMLLWLGIHFHFLDLRDRFIYQKYITQVVAISSFISLNCFIFQGMKNASPTWGIVTGTLNIYRIFKFVGIVQISLLTMCGVRAMQYQKIVPERQINEIERTIKNESQDVASSIELFLGQNYFGVIMVLSFFWISKQFSILRGVVYLLLLLGQLKRYRFKARKKWQSSIAILYVASIQFIILQFFNIPFINGGTLFQYIGVYSVPSFDPNESFAIWHFFVRRLSVIYIDLLYVIVLTWLVYCQQTIDDRRHTKIISELERGKSQIRTEQSNYWYSIMTSIGEWFESAKCSLYIHFDEIVIFYCLLTALNNSDICRGVFLIYFIVYEFIHLQQRRFYMRQHLSVGFVVLFTLYTLQLLFLRNLYTLNTIFIALGIPEVSETYQYPFYFISQYWDIIIGCIMLTFQIQIIQKTEIYKKYKRELLDDTWQMDYFRRQLISNGLIYCQLTALVVAYIPPANLLSLIFIFFFQIFLYLYYLHGSQKLVMETLHKYWPLMITLTLLILILRYTYTISVVNILVEMYFQQPTLLSDLGFDPDFNTLKLLGNGIALMLFCSYKRAFNSVDYHQYMEEQDNLMDQVDLEDSTWKYFYYGIKIRLAVFGVYHIPKLIFIFAFFISVYQSSYIGLLFACMIFLIVAVEQWNNWQDISVPFFVVIFLQIIIQYAFQAEILRQQQGQETITWIGIFDEYESKYWYLVVLFHICELFPVVDNLCKMTVHERFETFVMNHDREVRHLDSINKLLLILHGGYNEIHEFKAQSVSSISSQQIQDIHIAIFPVDQMDDHQLRFEKLYQFWAVQSPQRQYQEYLYIMPFYSALKNHQYMDRLFTQIGLELALFIIVITAYYERNFYSMFYIIVASIFANYSGVLDRRHSTPGIVGFRKAWACLCFLQMMEVVRKYTIMQWTPPSWDVRKPWWYYSYACDIRGKEVFKEDDPNDSISDFMKCQTDWNFWLSLQGYTWMDIWINFFAFLISVMFYRHFHTIQRLQEQEAQHQQLSNRTQSMMDSNSRVSGEPTDPQDFTYPENRKRVGDFIKFFIFCYFYKLALIVFLLIGMSADISSYTEIISSVYFFTAINLLYMSQKLERERNHVWSKLILFNTVVMILMSLYQAPFVKCPIIYEDSRYYYDNNECVSIQLSNHYYNYDFFIFLQDEFQILSNRDEERFKKYEGVSSLDVLYMFLSHIFGLNKTLDFRFGFNKETLMAFFFLLGLLQRNIWAHPYVKMYVEPYIQRQQAQQRVAAARLIEGIHLKRIWDFKYVQAQKEVHTSLQQRVQQRVKKWDEFFQFDVDHRRKSFFFIPEIVTQRTEEVQFMRFEEETEEKVQQLHTSFDSDDFNQFKENVKLVIKAERITQLHVAPVIHIYDACCVVKNATSDLDLLLRLKKLSLMEEKSQLEQVYLNDKIGLTHFYSDVMLQIESEISRVEIEILKLGQVESSEPSEEHKSVEKHAASDGGIMHFQEFQVDDISYQSAKTPKQRKQQEHEFEPSKKSSDVNQKSSVKKSFSGLLKGILIDVLTHDYYIRESIQQEQGISQKRLSALIFVFVAYYFQVVCVILMIVNSCFNANLLALFYPFSAFCYGLLENPVPTKKYWNFLLIYTIVVISLKFLYQMPIFCDSPPYHFIGFSADESCEPRLTTQVEKITRIDYVIGIRKYQDPETFMKSIWIELLLFLSQLIQRYLLQSQGIWDYFRLSQDQYFVPQFKYKAEKIPAMVNKPRSFQSEPDKQEDDFSEQDNQERSPDARSPSLFNSINQMHSDAQFQIANFYYRLFPTALPTTYINHHFDMQKQKVILKSAMMTSEQIKTGRDFYASGFIICLIILVYLLLFYPNIIAKRSYAHITQGQSQRFSSEVIFVLLICIAIIITDRMLFICRKVTRNLKDPQSQEKGNDFSKYTLMVKVAIHFILIISVHYYFFFVIPRKTNKRFQESYYLIFAYFLVCIYFIISAIQIRYGYPISEVTPIFTGSHKTVNSVAFKIYRAIPFLYELRVIIDWTFTTTALDLTQWFRLEDIFANLYICQAYMDQRIRTHELGQTRKSGEKCTNGCLFAMLFILIIILPILIFSTLNPAVEINNINQGKFTIKAAFYGPEEKLFFTLFQTNDIEIMEIPNDQFLKIQKVYGEIETSWQERMQKVRIKRFSDQEWTLAENYRDQIRNMIKSQNYQVEISCEWIFLKNDNQGGAKTYTGHSIVKAPDSFVNNFGKILAPKAPDAVFDINSLVPKFLYVGESAETEILLLEPVNIREVNDYYQDIRLIHKKTSDQVFFELVPTDDSQDLKAIGASINNRVEFFVLNELAFGSIIGAMSNNVSIIGIYATFVLTVGRILRLTYDKISTRVMFEEMPETHELFDLCQSIYIARIDGNYKKEEIFYELLIRIYRSPEILFKMTGTSIYDRQQHK